MLANTVFAKPTYTATPASPTFGSTYGSTSIPIVLTDETGEQLFDGKYGKYDWCERAGVSSVEDYWARYDNQNGYGYSWVGWRDATPSVTFDLGSSIMISQVGVHSYFNLPNNVVPHRIDVSFSLDSVHFGALQTRSFILPLVEDEAYWSNVDLISINARYIKLDIYRENAWLYVDELSINGMDGISFVPEPSSFLALGGGLIGLFKLKKRA